MSELGLKKLHGSCLHSFEKLYKSKKYTLKKLLVTHCDEIWPAGDSLGCSQGVCQALLNLGAMGVSSGNTWELHCPPSYTSFLQELCGKH